MQEDKIHHWKKYLVDKAINTKMAIKVTVAMCVNKKTHYHIRTYNSKAYSDYL